jgi:Destabilase
MTSYMEKYAVDCNQDGYLDCDDYTHIYQFGFDNCQLRYIEKEQTKAKLKDPKVGTGELDY